MKHWSIRLARYGLTQWSSLLLIVVLMSGGVWFAVLRPWPLKIIIDNVLQQHPLPASLLWLRSLPGTTHPQGLLAWLAAATVLLFLGGWVARSTQSYVQAGASSRMIHALGADLFHHVQRLSLRFHGRRTTGDLVKRITTDSGCVRQLMMSVILPLLASLVTLGSMLTILWKLDAALALAALLISPLLGFCIYFFARPMTERTYRQYELQGTLMAQAEQILSAMPIVHAFGQEEHEDRRFAQAWHQGDQAYRRVVSSELQFKVATSAVTALGTAIVMALGGWHVLEGKLTLGELTVFLSYLISLYSPLETLAYLSNGFASAAAGARRIFEILDTEPLVREHPTARALSEKVPTAYIQIEQITFGYEPNRPVLQDLSLEARPGETVALVGATGAGKSTLVSLIPRFFDPWQGRVLFNGLDVREVRLADLRHRISLVLQDPFILPLTVAENIAYGRPQASPAEILSAAQAANADEFIQELPHGYHTVIGERGATLSGGERQRLAIARALLKDAPLLILDEPTAALDAHTEKLLLQALQRLMHGRTTFIIAHRLSTVRRATRIAVLDGGRIAELGSHDQLLAAGGIYHHLYQLQFAPAQPAVPRLLTPS